MTTGFEMEQYDIIWRGPFTFDEIVDDEGYEDEEELYAII